MGFIASCTGLFLKDSCKLLYIYKYKISHLGWGLVISELKAFPALVHVTLLHVLKQLENFGLQSMSSLFPLNLSDPFMLAHMLSVTWLLCVKCIYLVEL